MAIGNISNGEAGSSVRTKLNQTIDKVNESHGWITVTDDAITAGSPLVVSEGNIVPLPNNAAGGITTYAPTGGNGLYNGTRLVGDSLGDEFEVRITLKAYTSDQNGGFNFLIDISPSGDGSTPIVTYPVRMFRGTGAGNVQQYSTNIPYFTLGTFLANGGQLLIESVTGNTTVYDISYYIKKVSSGA